MCSKKDFQRKSPCDHLHLRFVGYFSSMSLAFVVVLPPSCFPSQLQIRLRSLPSWRLSWLAFRRSHCLRRRTLALMLFWQQAFHHYHYQRSWNLSSEGLSLQGQLSSLGQTRCLKRKMNPYAEGPSFSHSHYHYHLKKRSRLFWRHSFLLSSRQQGRASYPFSQSGLLLNHYWNQMRTPSPSTSSLTRGPSLQVVWYQPSENLSQSQS